MRFNIISTVKTRLGFVVVMCGSTLLLAAEAGSPSAVLLAFYQAIYAGDSTTAKTMVTDASTFAVLVDGLADAMSARKRLSDAGVEKFGEAGKNLGGEDSADLAQRVNASEVKTDGDDATITAGSGKPVKLHRINGVWKLDLAATFGNDGLARKSALQHAIAKAANQTTDNVKAGAYKIADEAREAFAKNRANALAAMANESAK